MWARINACGGDNSSGSFVDGSKGAQAPNRMRNAVKPRAYDLGLDWMLSAAVSYSPTRSPWQYHRRWRA